jgi:hypothetical protein
VRFDDSAEAAAARTLLDNSHGRMSVVFSNTRRRQLQDFAAFQHDVDKGLQQAGSSFPRSYNPLQRHVPAAMPRARGLWTELFVQRISPHATIHDLRALAATFGPLERVRRPLNKST